MTVTTQFTGKVVEIRADGRRVAELHPNGAYTQPFGGRLKTALAPEIQAQATQCLAQAQAAYQAATAHVATLPYTAQALARIDAKERLGWLTAAQAATERRGVHMANGQAMAEDREHAQDARN